VIGPASSSVLPSATRSPPLLRQPTRGGSASAAEKYGRNQGRGTQVGPGMRLRHSTQAPRFMGSRMPAHACPIMHAASCMPHHACLIMPASSCMHLPACLWLFGFAEVFVAIDATDGELGEGEGGAVDVVFLGMFDQLVGRVLEDL